MDASQYNQIARWLRARPRALRGIVAFNELFKYACYILYPVLLVLLAVTGRHELLVRAVAIPVVSFGVLSVFRRLYNAPRPYEALDIAPLIKKDTKGKSFPSRHVFSAFMIAMAWCAGCLPVGVVLLICSAAMAAVRVAMGVHFPRDVIAGALIAIVVGLIGFWLV